MKKIAARFGTTLEALIALNPQIYNINTIYVGQVIRIR
jgi:LysM repeat protein